MRSLKSALILFGLVLAVPLATQAHTLRVLLNRLVIEPGKKGTIYIGYGHLLPIDEVIGAEELDQFQLHTNTGSVKPLTKAGRSLHANEVVFEAPGLYQAELARKPLIYCSYTDSTGKPGFIRQPKNVAKIPAGATLKLSARGHQFSKALVLCGEGSGQVAAPLGHLLEIVVESQLGKEGFSADSPLKVRVLFEGKPLPGVKVSAASVTLSPDGLPESASETDAQGRTTLELPEPGIWVLDVRHQIDSAPADRQAFDVESYVASVAVPVAEEK